MYNLCNDDENCVTQSKMLTILPFTGKARQLYIEHKNCVFSRLLITWAQLKQ